MTTDSLRAQRDGWRMLAMRALQGDFGEIPPVEFLVENADMPPDKTDRSAELVDELRRRAPYVTDVDTMVQPDLATDGDGPTTYINAQLGRAAIQISRRARGDRYRFSMAYLDEPGTSRGYYLFSPREVSFELLLRYLDFVIAGYKLGCREVGA